MTLTLQSGVPKSDFNAPNFDTLFEAKPSPGLSITTQCLSRRFSEQIVLNNLTLHAPAGQFLAIVGRSGCGKSTLLRLLAGLDRPSDGAFWLGAKPHAPPENAVRIMFQEPRLLPWATVAENVAIGLGVEYAKDEADKRALVALTSVGLETRATEWPTILSGGQKQRIALARALVSRPRLLLLDEPLGALDALTRIEMQSLIELVWLQYGFTAVLVTHDVAEALALADRVIMIEDGAVALDVAITLKRPRRRGSVDLALLEEKILKALLKKDAIDHDYVI